MLSLSELFFSKILLLKRFVSNVQIIEGVSEKERLENLGILKDFGEIMLDKRYITPAQYEQVRLIQRHTLLTCKSCGLKYHLDELAAEDHFQCEVCQAIIISLSELASLDLEPLLHDQSNSSNLIESEFFKLESSHSASVDTTSPSAVAHKHSTLRFSSLDESLSLLGSKIANYQLLEKIGEGGSCVVFKAETPQKEIVAMKLLKNTGEQEENIVRRLVQEAKLTKKLRHPNIVQLFDSGSEQGYYFLVMEYIQGETLREKILREIQLNPSEAVDILEQVLYGLEVAHKAKIIHRDIKPDNIMITQDGVAKLADFGLARGMNIDAHITKTGLIVGTPYYMSPEQAQGHSLDHRCDIYSLGATFFYMLTGKVPFQGTTPIEIILKHISKDVESPKKYNPHIPDEICYIVFKMMAKDPANRYQSTQEVLKDIHRIRLCLQLPYQKTFTCICGEPYTYVPQYPSSIRQCRKCSYQFWLPPPHSQSRVTYFYPDWKEIVLAKIAINHGWFSPQEAAQFLILLIEAKNYGIEKEAEDIFGELGLGRDRVFRLQQELKNIIHEEESTALFGQIALQKGYITLSQLRSALRHQQQNPLYIGEILVQQGTLASSHRADVLSYQNKLVASPLDIELRKNLLQEKNISRSLVQTCFREVVERSSKESNLNLARLLLERNAISRHQINRQLYEIFQQILLSNAFSF